MKGEGWRDWHRWEMDRDGALAEILELLGILEILGALEILGILEPLGAGDSKTLEIRDWLEIEGSRDWRSRTRRNQKFM